MCAFGVLVKPRRRGSRPSQTPHNSTRRPPERERKWTKIVAGEGKKVRNFGRSGGGRSEGGRSSGERSSGERSSGGAVRRRGWVQGWEGGKKLITPQWVLVQHFLGVTRPKKCWTRSKKCWTPLTLLNTPKKMLNTPKKCWTRSKNWRTPKCCCQKMLNTFKEMLNPAYVVEHPHTRLKSPTHEEHSQKYVSICKHGHTNSGQMRSGQMRSWPWFQAARKLGKPSQTKQRGPRTAREGVDQELSDVNPTVPVDLDVDFLLKNLRTSRRGAAAGPSGMTCGTLFGEVATMFARGQIPPEILGWEKMTALQELDGGVRWIAVEGRDAQVSGQDSRTAIWSIGRPQPVPVRTVHKSRNRVRSTRGAGIDQFGQRSHNVDGVGAYDTIFRKALMRGVADMADELSPFVRQFYSSPSGGSTRKIQQVEGGEQGDPLMPLLFSVGQHRALVQVQAGSREGKDCSLSLTTSTSCAHLGEWETRVVGARVANKSRHQHPFGENKVVECRRTKTWCCGCRHWCCTEGETRGRGVERRPLIADIEARSENPSCPSRTPRIYCEGVGLESSRTIVALWTYRGRCAGSREFTQDYAEMHDRSVTRCLEHQGCAMPHIGVAGQTACWWPHIAHAILRGLASRTPGYLRDIGVEVPSWEALAEGLRPEDVDMEPEPSQPNHGWQKFASVTIQTLHLESVVWPTLSPAEEAMVRSQSGPSLRPVHRDAHDSVTRIASESFRFLLLRLLRSPLPLRLLDVLGHHRAVCSTGGALGRRGFAARSAVAQICWEGGVRVSLNAMLRDLDIAPTDAAWRWLQKDWPCTEDASWPWTPQWCHHCTGTPPTEEGQTSRIKWHCGRPGGAHPELCQGNDRGRLVVEVGVRWSEETKTFLWSLACAKASSVPRRMYGSARAAWYRRWTCLLACSSTKAVACSLLGKEGSLRAGENLQ